MKILILDIETFPNLSWTWGLWQQNIAPNQVVKGQRVASYAAKWLGDKRVFFDSVYHSSEKHMLQGMHKLLDGADVVVHQNGERFDVPMLNTEFIKHGMKPPSPFKQVDLLKVSKQKFRFPSNKLEYVVKALKLGEKIKENVTFELWTECMEGKAKAWERMKRYNIHDTILAERLYKVYLPWVPNHPNRNSYADLKAPVCPHCGSKHLHKRGHAVASHLRYQAYECQDCGARFRDNRPLNGGKKLRYVTVR